MFYLWEAHGLTPVDYNPSTAALNSLIHKSCQLFTQMNENSCYENFCYRHVALTHFQRMSL